MTKSLVTPGGALNERISKLQVIKSLTVKACRANIPDVDAACKWYSKSIGMDAQVPASSWPGVRCGAVVTPAGRESGSADDLAPLETREDKPRRRVGMNRDKPP